MGTNQLLVNLIWLLIAQQPHWPGLNHRIPEWFELEGKRKTIGFQPLCWRLGHLLLNQVARRPLQGLSAFEELNRSSSLVLSSNVACTPALHPDTASRSNLAIAKKGGEDDNKQSDLNFCLWLFQVFER